MRSTWNRSRRFVRTKIGGLHLDLNANYENSVLIAGSGRGGTTWLAEIINYKHRYRFIFEPFFYERVGICGNFAWRQYLRPETHDPKYLIPASLVFSGKVRSDWTDAYNRRFLCSQRLVKDVRCNLMLKWISAHFPAMPIVLLLRHPCAVAASRLQQGWDDGYRDLFNQSQLVQDYLEPFSTAMHAAKSPFERHIFLWCIENYVPLKQLCRGDALVMFYEDLCVRPETELDRLSCYLGVTFGEGVRQALTRPSSQTRKASSINRKGADVASSWQDQVSRDMTTHALQILQLFGLGSVYSEGPMPLVEADNLLGNGEFSEPVAPRWEAMS